MSFSDSSVNVEFVRDFTDPASAASYTAGTQCVVSSTAAHPLILIGLAVRVTTA